MKPFVLSFLAVFFFCCNEPIVEPIPEPEPEAPAEVLTYLALGDSYTIGEGVEEEERFPQQLADVLEKLGFNFNAPALVARTGWTTTKLQEGIDAKDNLLDNYSMVTLLIGVNNQFQGQKTDIYEKEFPELLNQAIAFAGGNKDRVFVLSIPDYGFTPFGNRLENVSEGIDEFNAVNRRITEEAGIAYFDITPISREGLNNPDLVADDGLHPSGEQYRMWVNELTPVIRERLK